MKKLSTRGWQAAEAIRDVEEFDTHGALSARTVSESGLSNWDAGRLSGPDLEAFRTDASAIRYVVYSYSTPIAWRTLSGRWHKVSEKFSSSTTSAHQGRLYLIRDENGE